VLRQESGCGVFPSINSSASRSMRSPSRQLPSGPRSYRRMMPTGRKPTLL
jgi:hypothetical protein